MNRHINYHGKVKLYNHNLSYRNFFSGELGELRPVWLEDAAPGDIFQYKPEVRIYFSPLVYPVLSSMKARVDVFFVPNRLAWKDWNSFITGGPDDNLNPVYPSMRNVHAAAVAAGTEALLEQYLDDGVQNKQSLLNNLGHPTISSFSASGGDAADDPYDMIPLWDYLYIWDEYYRDEEKESPITQPGGFKMDIFDFFADISCQSALINMVTNGGLPRIAWSKDYFTAASLMQQRGGDVPLLTNPIFKPISGSSLPSSEHYLGIIGSTGPDPGAVYVADGVNYPRLESVLTINGIYFLRSAAAWLNNNVIGGTRYTEVSQVRYHVVSSDARLQRPEMVGSISIPVNIDVVTQTSSTTDDGVDIFPLGDRAGKASVIGSGKTLTFAAEEFGYFIGILHIAPKAAYFQGIRRNLQREDKFDFWQPEFENVPQREIRNNEIFADGHLSPEDGGVFGYIGQYDEYRHHNDEVHGDFQDTLLAWTMARKFSALPSLASSKFLRVDSDPNGNNRIFAVPDSNFSHIFGVVNNIVTPKRLIKNREARF